MGQENQFDGAKIALFLGNRLAVLLRDDKQGLPFAGYWDMPGGGREGGETPWSCAQRECQEELGLIVSDDAVVWQSDFEDAGGTKWFFVARLDADVADRVVFGDEGQRWALMTPQAFLDHPKAVPAFQKRLSTYLALYEKGEVG